MVRGRNRTTTPATLDVELRYAVKGLQENFVRAVVTVMLDLRGQLIASSEEDMNVVK
ncbi:hypothetical protein M0D69_03780 [Caballeronia sp. SEWSISQ10-4 2]|uniref:hypothetical protein n=1 Tax=Caballeronia sp. SEWSISQ10-4 2 TaxID=2937438 RepID=UPI00264B7A1D|nr:hypothetical protein [Caballeronia sp. SEWSISQ10-4 2]MDN7177144.1 hypothetical protein [Caballeronia sp. SEWSISQ10-4 2]